MTGRACGSWRRAPEIAKQNLNFVAGDVAGTNAAQELAGRPKAHIRHFGTGSSPCSFQVIHHAAIQVLNLRHPSLKCRLSRIRAK